jgi:hypothetical protein
MKADPDDSAQTAESIAEMNEAQEGRAQDMFHLQSPDVWEGVLAAILARR